MLKSILLVLSACFIWGWIYIVPGCLTGFSPLEVTLGGYFFLGLLSCLLMMGKGLKKCRSIPWSIWQKAIRYAFIVNIFYFFSLATGLRYSNASVIALIMGLSPITISFYGNWRQKECSYRQLVVPSIFIGSGLICFNWEAFLSLSGQASYEYAVGLLCGIFSLLAWNWYVVANAKFLKQHTHISSSDWATMIGIGTFVWVLMIIPVSLAMAETADLQKFTHFEADLFYFLTGCLVLGVGCSWLASYLWNLGSQALPLSLAGQLTIFETIFGILFFYLFKSSLPTFLEFFGMVTTLTGVCLSVHQFRKADAVPPPELIHSPA